MSHKEGPRRKEIHTALLESESHYRMIFDRINDGIIIHDFEGNIYDVNQTMYERLGYTKAEMLKMSLQDLVSPEFGEKIKPRMKQLEERGVAIFESADKRKDGTYMPVEISTHFVDYKGKRFIQSVVRDIHERRLAENLVSANRQEKEVLLSELQTRAKFDNLVFSLVLDRLIKLDEPKAIADSIQNHKKRLQILGFIQGKIYQHKNPLRINFKSVMQSLTRYVYNLYLQKDRSYDIQTDFDNVYFDLPTSMNCAQILAELLSNALMHGFDGQKHGSIVICSNQGHNGKQTITVADNGVGFPEELDLNEVDTTGLRMVTLLVEQLAGKIRLDRKAGTKFQILF